MRRLFLLLPASLLLALVLAACGGGGGEEAPTTPTGETPRAGPVTIDLWHSEIAANEDALKSLVTKFNASQDEVRVRATFQGTYADAMTKIIASLGSSELPALIFMSETEIQRLIDSGAIVPVQDFIDRDHFDLSDLDQRTVGYYTVEGKLWAMPFALDMALLYYNKAMFREVGLDPERPPQDLEEVREYSEKLLKKDGSEVTRSGLAIDIKPWLTGMLDQHGDLYVNEENGHDGRATEVLFDNDTGRWFFEWWHDMIDRGLAVNVGRNPEFIENFLAMAAGRAAMTFSYAGALRSVIDALEAGIGEGVEIGITTMPGVPGSENLSASVYAFWIVGQRPQEEQEAAWKFVQWLVEPEQQAEWFSGSGYLPASRSAPDLPAAQEILESYPLFQIPLDAYLSTPPKPPWGAILGPSEEVTQAILGEVEEMLLAGKDPDQALADAAAESNQIIEEYNRRVGE
jgi:sn-glycerol 3-phosphate transport system substrate-binding protein